MFYVYICNFMPTLQPAKLPIQLTEYEYIRMHVAVLISGRGQVF